ncbi:sigma-70 family RNA polymerase sigma factor [Actinomadura barringtoniae]|uniref:Sigma-70 family RNA polymerase sigma factor n=1 Tax=Actinomadura barringtoniae TaxID=1427535 RepID=A0A939PAI2_9ACTN|nr:sigma-70 family RNA polymerase sigma factor [Actinomadura barringtoniae]MBO2448985.1 sigma-70 family RNA polymerase sigma factor [Actinomadura barringtoniae]
MDQAELAVRFDEARRHLRGVAFRMLGSADEADDAVQETWLRASRDGASGVVNLPGWLTTIISRICLDMLRARRRRSETLADMAELDLAANDDPEGEAVLADSVGLALLVVLDALGPDERVAFVLHDMFSVPFAEIAGIVGKTEVATKKLASRARARIDGTPALPPPDLDRQRAVVEAFLAASRAGDLDGLVSVLAPDVVRRSDARPDLRGARNVAEETRTNVARARFARLALVDGVAGILVAPNGRLAVAIRLTVDGDHVTEVDVVTDPARLAALDLGVLQG